jgi:hypothetical protein
MLYKVAADGKTINLKARAHSVSTLEIALHGTYISHGIYHLFQYTYIQQDATLHSLFISGNCSTCFGWYLHPSSGANTTVSTVSVICHIVIATCRLTAGSSNGVTNTRCCRYSCMRSWWWVKVPPKTCRAVSRYNKLCKVASCWIYIGIYLRCMDPKTLNLKKVFTNYHQPKSILCFIRRVTHSCRNMQQCNSSDKT